MYFNTKTDVAQNLIDDFFLTLTVRGPFHRKEFKWKKYESTGLISDKTEVLYAELNERVEAATGSYSVTGDSLQYIYYVPMAKNHRNIWLRCLIHEFCFTDVFNDYRAAILKKNSLWLLPFYMVVATYFYFEKVRRAIRAAIVSNLLKGILVRHLFFLRFLIPIPLHLI